MELVESRKVRPQFGINAMLWATFAIALTLWLERQSYSPRYVTASWLLCAVIIGNLLVPLVLA